MFPFCEYCSLHIQYSSCSRAPNVGPLQYILSFRHNIYVSYHMNVYGAPIFFFGLPIRLLALLKCSNWPLRDANENTYSIVSSPGGGEYLPGNQPIQIRRAWRSVTCSWVTRTSSPTCSSPGARTPSPRWRTLASTRRN